MEHCLRIFFHGRSKRACFFQVEQLPKKFYDAAKQEKTFTQAPGHLEIKHCCKHGRLN